MPQLQPDLFEAPVPYSGKTPASRHASWTGAVASAPTRGAKTAAYLRLLASGPITDQDAADRMHWPLSSVCSIRNGLGDRVVPGGFRTAEWGSGRRTRRVMWEMKR